MKERTSVINWSGDHEETCLQVAKHLGTNKIRRKLFTTVYGRGSKPRSKKQLMKHAALKLDAAQQAQNELDHLTKYGLIIRVDNEGSVDDGSHYLYRKDPEVRAHRAKILKFADDPKRAATVPTKRSRQVEKVVVKRSPSRNTRGRRLGVLYLTANPDPKKHLRVDGEVRQVQDAVKRSKLRDKIELHLRPAADLDSVLEGLNDHAPTIVHFSGHGFGGGIAVDHADVKSRAKVIVSFDLLANAIAAVDKPPRLVILSSCSSAGARKAFLPPAEALIVMNQSISDVAAVAFAAKFYAAIASGQSLKAAFNQGKVGIKASSISEADVPDLLLADGFKASKAFLS